MLVLLALANRINKHTGYAYPSLKTLQKSTKLAIRTIRYALRTLEIKHLLETILAPSRYGSNTYRLLVPHCSTKIDRTKSETALDAYSPAAHAAYPVIEPGKKNKPTRARNLEDGKEITPQFLTYLGATPDSEFSKLCLNGSSNGNGIHHHKEQ